MSTNTSPWSKAFLARYVDQGAEDDVRVAGRLVERLLIAAKEGQRRGSVLESLVVQALVRQARGNRPALTRAEPEGYVRLFLDEGPPMTALLGAVADHGVAGGYAPDSWHRTAPWWEAVADRKAWSSR